MVSWVPVCVASSNWVSVLSIISRHGCFCTLQAVSTLAHWRLPSQQVTDKLHFSKQDEHWRGGNCQVIPVSFCWMSPPLGWIPTSGWPVIFVQFFFALCHLVKLWNFWFRNFCWLLLLPANIFSFQNMSFRRSMWDLLKKYRPGRASLCGNVISDSPPLTLSSPSVSS